MSADGAMAFSRILDTVDPPRALRASITAGQIPDIDLPAIISHLWTRTDSPTENLGEEDWVPVFRATGFFCYPPLVVAGEDGARTPVNRPGEPVTLYRGSTEIRARRMSWAFDAAVAKVLGRRHARYAPAALYKATVPPIAVLAYLERQAEGWTVVVDPAYLTNMEIVDRIEANNG